MKTRFSVIFFLLFAIITTGYAQNITISGKVGGEDEEILASASVILLSAKDSTLLTFALANQEGYFQLGPVPPKDYLLQITFLGYQQYLEPLLFSSNPSLSPDLGKILLKVASNKIQEVVIKGESTPLVVKKDTLEYNAAAFETQPQDVVEDLLRQMPGVEVEDDGTVIAQGEEVKKVTVDGKEFFGNDPKIATKNIAAEAVKSVQFFDRRSDMSEFTGVDDGEREKTMNLQLKPEYRSGYFGNVGAAAGTTDRYESNLNLNRFDSKSQISVIGNFNNINKQGFSTDQYMNFMNSMGGFGGRRGASDLPISRGLSDGFVRTNAGGVNVNYDFSNKTELNVNYFLNDIQNDIDKFSSRENFLPNGQSYFTNSANDQLSTNTSHQFQMRFTHKIDSTQDIRLTSNFRWNLSDLESTVRSEVLNAGQAENNSDAAYLYAGNNNNIGGSLMYRKLLSKTINRSITIRGTINALDNEVNGDLDALNEYFTDDPGMEVAEQIIQAQLDKNDQLTYGLNISYIEPLKTGNYLEGIYRRSNVDNTVIKDVFDQLNGMLDFNENLSNRYRRNFAFDQFGLAYHWNGVSSSLSVEGLLQHSSLDGKLLLEDSSIQNNNTTFLPRIQYSKELGSGKNLRIRYNTNVREPSLEQLQPIIDNSDPINQYIGNPDLIPEYNHNLRINYFLFDQFSFSSLFTYFNVRYTRNNIINQTIINDRFQRITSPVNVDYDLNVSGNISYDTPIRSLGMKFGVNSNLTYGRSILFINDQRNYSNRYVSRFGISLENRNKKVWDTGIDYTVTYNRSTYDLSADRNLEFINQNIVGNFRYNPTQKWSLATNMRIRIFDEQNFGEGQIIPIWRASLSHYFLAGNRGELEISAFDLLNQNLGISRSTTLNYVENEETISLGRYIMLSFKYALRSAGSAGNSGNIQRIRRR